MNEESENPILHDALLRRSAFDELRDAISEDWQTTLQSIFSMALVEADRDRCSRPILLEDCVSTFLAEVRLVQRASNPCQALSSLLHTTASWLAELWLTGNWDHSLPAPVSVKSEPKPVAETFPCPCVKCGKQASFHRAGYHWRIACEGCGYDKGWAQFGGLITWVIEETKMRNKTAKPLPSNVHLSERKPAELIPVNYLPPEEMSTKEAFAVLREASQIRQSSIDTAAEIEATEAVSSERKRCEDCSSFLPQNHQWVRDHGPARCDSCAQFFPPPALTPKPELGHIQCPACDGQMTVESTPNDRVMARCLGKCKFVRSFESLEFKSWMAQTSLFRMHLESTTKEPNPPQFSADDYGRLAG
jgi:hypothetical protein